jgi:signal transduction histidine kinase
MVGILLYIWQYRRKKRENELKLTYEKDLHQKELLATQLEMQKKTMQEIGGEIHDNVGQKLTLASLYVQQLIYENHVAASNANVTSINTILNDALAELRQLSKTLCDDSIENNTLPELLQLESEKIKAIKNCQVYVTNPATFLHESYAVKSVLVRITQEFIQNAIKYAACQSITITLDKTSDSFTLTLADDGKGFDVKHIKPSGIGIQNMKKRVAVLGGQFSISSNEKGTVVKVVVPIKTSIA